MIDGSGMTVSAGAGAPMSLLGNTAADRDLRGAEFVREYRVLSEAVCL